MTSSAGIIWTARDAAAATGGHAPGEWRATGLSAHLDDVRRGDLFVALPDADGDGHDRIAWALKAGAVAAIAARAPAGVDPARLLMVDDPAAALRALACAARRRSGARIVAIAGMAGRTAARRTLDVIFDAMGQAQGAGTRVFAGGDAGLLPLAAMHAGCDYGVFDAGRRHGGDEAFMAAAYPHILLTDLAASAAPGGAYWTRDHAALDEMFRHVMPGSTVIAARDNPLFDRMKPLAMARNIRFCGYGVHENAEARLAEWLEAANGSRVRAEILGREYAFTIPVPGRAAVMHALGGLLAAAFTGGDLKKAVAALSAMKPVMKPAMNPAVNPDTGAFRSPAAADGRVSLFDGGRAAAPSMRAAFRVLALVDPGRGGRRIAVLGDMPSPGRNSADIALPLETDDMNLVYTGGALVKKIADTLPQDRQVPMRGGVELAEIVPDVLTPGDVVMVKESRESRKGVVVEALRALPDKKRRGRRAQAADDMQQA